MSNTDRMVEGPTEGPELGNIEAAVQLPFGLGDAIEIEAVEVNGQPGRTWNGTRKNADEE